MRAGAGGQGKPIGDGKPAGPDRTLGKGVRGIKKERAERQGLVQSPNEKTRPRAVSPLWGNLVALLLPFIEGRSATCKLLSDSCLTVFRVMKTPTLKKPKALIINDLHVASCIRQW